MGFNRVQVPSQPFDWNDFNFTYKDVAIGGKLVKGHISLPEANMMQISSDEEMREYVRTMMATQLAEYMIAGGLIEFTQMKDNVTLYTTITARCYLAPNDQVKILRTHDNDLSGK
jgi:hypothetical protein